MKKPVSPTTNESVAIEESGGEEECAGDPGSARTLFPGRGELFILSAPSGAGKTTLIHSLLSGGLDGFGSIHFSVSHTTREPREGERNGKAYHFVARERFEEMIEAGEFLEWARVHNNFYGTSLAEVVPRLRDGVDVVMDIDVQGTERILQRFPKADVSPLCAEVHSIFIIPPSYESLAARLRGRGPHDEEEVAGRLAVSAAEMRRAGLYDYVIVNDDAASASKALASIVLEKRHRRGRMRGALEEILETFEHA